MSVRTETLQNWEILVRMNARKLCRGMLNSCYRIAKSDNPWSIASNTPKPRSGSHVVVQCCSESVLCIEHALLTMRQRRASSILTKQDLHHAWSSRSHLPNSPPKTLEQHFRRMKLAQNVAFDLVMLPIYLLLCLAGPKDPIPHASCRISRPEWRKAKKIINKPLHGVQGQKQKSALSDPERILATATKAVNGEIVL